MIRNLKSRTRRECLDQVRTFTVYYGIGDYERLRAYDMVILEPAGHTREGLSRLKASGTLVIAYVSFMELRPEEQNRYGLREEDWLQVNGAPVRNEAFHTRLVDLRSRRWAGLLLERIRQLLTVEGYDGVFIDTVGNVEWPSLPEEVRKSQALAAVGLIKTARGLFRDHLLIQNNGVSELIFHTADWIDAVTWENPLFTGPHLEWAEKVASRLRRLSGCRKFRTLLLYEDRPGTAESMRHAMQHVWRNDWLMARCSPNYL
ncbi:endo alpha-1,4 polygalactosaminidase [Gorillibacterium sp. sgz5001074]|uniref:endo alpha-1,4 polygalactosaminidase n=1 Tax=Gorillibacterium sp. sgz5001074 TaxID=3446695 RepID=UPI003F662893